MAAETPKRAARGERYVRGLTTREHYLGVAILAITMLFCTWVLIRGLAPKGWWWGAYDPALFGGQAVAAAPAATGDGAPTEEAPLYDEESGDGGESTGGAAGGGARPEPKYLPLGAPAGWQAGQVETFSADNLYEKINGRAEAYIGYGVVGMECLSYSNQADPQSLVDVYIYDMGEPLQGYGMFTSERAGGEESAPFGQLGYRSSGSVNFWRDRYYVQVTASADTAPAKQAADALATELVKKLPAADFALPAEAWFPKDGLKPGTIMYVKKDALGQEFLDEVWSAKYDIGGTTVEAWLSKRADAAEAQQLAGKLKEFLTTAGKVSEATIGGQPMVVCDQTGLFDIVFSTGDMVGGVTYVEGRQPAETVVARLVAAL